MSLQAVIEGPVKSDSRKAVSRGSQPLPLGGASETANAGIKRGVHGLSGRSLDNATDSSLTPLLIACTFERDANGAGD